MRRRRVPIAGVVAALLLLAGYVVGIRQPRSADIARMETDTEQLRAQQAPLRHDIEGLTEASGRKAELETALQDLEHLIPSGLAQPTLLVDLQAAAGEAGVSLVSVSFGDPEVPEGAPQAPIPGTVLVSMPVTVIAQGLFEGITDMMRRVEGQLDRAVLVGALALTEGDDGFPQIRGTWSGQAFALLAADDALLIDPDAPRVSPPTTDPKGDG